MAARIPNVSILSLVVLILWGALACSSGGSSGGSGGGGGAGAPSNRARFTFGCDLNGLVGNLTLDVEAINTAAPVFGAGPNPDITGVIGTGGVLYVTGGELVSPTARYIFTGDNQFADFTDTTTNQRFRVQWVADPQGLVMVINPFGPGPTQQSCVLTGQRYL